MMNIVGWALREIQVDIPNVDLEHWMALRAVGHCWVDQGSWKADDAQYAEYKYPLVN